MTTDYVEQFQLTRLMRGVTPTSFLSPRSALIFQLTRLMRGVTFIVCNGTEQIEISTHTPHARRDV